MARTKRGMLARSLAGHDQDKLYIIMQTEAEYVWLVDGIRRTVDKPKKKNRRHIQPICRIPESLREILEDGRPFQDEQIRQIIQSESRSRQEDKYV